MDQNTFKLVHKELSQIPQLPTLSTIYKALEKAIADPSSSAKTIGAIIERDISLTTKLLQVVNSAFYGFPRKVGSINQAVVILGFNEVKHIALSISVIEIFNNVTTKNNSFDYKRFWKHSLAVGVCASVIAKKVTVSNINNVEIAFTAGLIHDIGLITAIHFFQDKYAKILQVCKSNPLFIHEVEKKLFNYTHENIGEYLAEKWKLPKNLTEIIATHHTPPQKKQLSEYLLESIIHTADSIVRALGITIEGDHLLPPFKQDCWDTLNLTYGHIDQIIEETLKTVEELSILLLK